MHIRQSDARGMHVVDDSTQQTVGILHEPLIDADNGRIIGFFVLPVFLGEAELFLQTMDIVSWGTRVHVLSADRLGAPEDFVRLHARLEDPRPFLGQALRERRSGKALGSLDDVQFNTRHFTIDWLFPRRWFFLRQPLPASDVLEVTEDAVWMKDPIRPSTASVQEKAPVQRDLLQDVVPQVQTRRNS